MDHYVIMALDDRNGMVATCEGDRMTAPLVESKGSASLAVGETDLRRAAHDALDHTLDQMGYA